MSLVNDLWTYRGLVGNLAQRELKSRYKRSILGWAWSLVNPAATLATYAIVFGVLFKPVPEVAGNGKFSSFAMFLFAGLVIWNFFSSVVNGSMSALIGAGPLLKKVYFPAECAPAANMLVAMSQACIEATILVVIMIAVGNAGWTMVLVPVVLVLLGVFAFGIGLALSVANVYLRDIAYLVAVLMNLVFYSTPIIWNIKLLDGKPRWTRQLVQANPIHQFVEALRDAVYHLEWPSLGRLSYLVIVSFATFALGWAIFRRFGDRVSEAL